MIKNILHNMTKGALLYIRIKPEWLSVRDIKSNHYYEDIPIAALRIEGRNEVMAVGFQARELVSNSENYRLVNGFEDEDGLISNRHAAEGTLKYFMDSVIRKGLIKPPIVAILHPVDCKPSAYTQPDGQLLAELCLRAGAKEAYVWIGQELMYKDILTGEFPQSGSWIGGIPSKGHNINA
jgi:actin-like ATPase involved in cell morphogenesis